MEADTCKDWDMDKNDVVDHIEPEEDILSLLEEVVHLRKTVPSQCAEAYRRAFMECLPTKVSDPH